MAPEAETLAEPDGRTDPETNSEASPETGSEGVSETLPRRTGNPRRVRLDRGGPILVEGPIEVCIGDGPPEVIDRWTVALCACGNSGRYPLCDGTHRKARPSPAG